VFSFGGPWLCDSLVHIREDGLVWSCACGWPKRLAPIGLQWQWPGLVAGTRLDGSRGKAQGAVTW
jgi:hypothetical protein